MRRGFLELFVFDQLPDQFPARIVLLRFFLGWLLIDRKQAAALDVKKVRRHDDEFAGHVDVQFLERLQILEVLPGDALDGDVVDVELVALDQIKQEVERALENLEFDFVIGSHGRAGNALAQVAPAMNPNAVHDAKPEHDHEDKRSAITDEWKRNASDRQNRNRHPDVLKDVGENKSSDSNDEQQSALITGTERNEEAGHQEEGESPEQKHSPDKSPLFADGGENVIVVHGRSGKKP